jgi:uncharacterized membrane protein HdeD (DUF308 family)
MAEKVKEYTKLPGTKKGFFIGKYSLWQGTDHLLHIFARFGIEDYKRFYFSDIQAIVTRKTNIGKIQNVILGSLILLFLLPAFIFDGGWSIFYIAGSSIVFLFLLVNLSRGPTCETRLMTAVQTEKLQSLHRLKKTFKVMDRIRPHIQQTQGILTREELNKIPTQPTARQDSPGYDQAAASPMEAAKHENGRVHMILFVLLLLNGVLVSVEFFMAHVVPTILGSVISLCSGIFVIIALVRQHNSDLPGSLRIITWTTLGFVGVTFVMGYIAGMVFAIKNPSSAYNQWEIFKAISSISPWDSPLKLSYNIFVLCGAFSLGIPGLIIHQRSVISDKKREISASSTSRPTAGSRTPEPG